jgi:hypothetical protein
VSWCACYSLGVNIAVPAVTRIVPGVPISQITIGDIAKETIVFEDIVGHLIPETYVVADRALLDSATTRVGILGWRCFWIENIIDHDTP